MKLAREMTPDIFFYFQDMLKYIKEDIFLNKPSTIIQEKMVLGKGQD